MRTAVLFDADGVVIRSEPFTVALEKTYGIPASRLNRFFREDFPDCLVGKAALTDRLDRLISEIRWEGSRQDLLDFWFRSEHRVDAELINQLAALRKAGYLVALATNQEQNRARYLRNEMGLDAVFDRLFFSCELGAKKPDPEFYRKIQQMLQSDGVSKIIFFDDHARNVEAAIHAGWQAMPYSSIQDFHTAKTSGLDF